VEYRVEYGDRVRDTEWAYGADEISRNYWPLESILSLLWIMGEK
jgi:hypothetical protein